MDANNSTFDNQIVLINEKGYIILSEIGCGSFGKVYKVKEKTTKELFAIKETPFKGEEGYDRAMIEVANGAALNHVNVVKFNEYFVDRKANKLFISMELCDYNLSEWFARNTKNRSYTEGIRMFREITRGIQYIHDRNIIHRDLKPANVLIKNNVCKITVLWIEQASGLWCEKSADIYPLGLIMFEFFISIDNDTEFVSAIINIQKPECVLTEKFFERHKHRFNKKFNEAKELLLQMLAFDPEKRPTIQNVLSHPFLSENEIIYNTNDNNDLQENVELTNLILLHEEDNKSKNTRDSKSYNRDACNKNEDRNECCDDDKSIFLSRNVTHTQSIQNNTFEISVYECYYKNKFRELRTLGMGEFSTVFKAEYKFDSTVYAINQENSIEISVDKCEYKKGYIILVTIGCGAFGKVYKVKDKTTKELFAIKETKYFDKKSYDRAIKEVANGVALNHVNVVKFNVFFVNRNLNQLFITMELCDYNLSEWFRRNNTKNRSYTEGMGMFREIACGIQYIHDRNIIHRNLKPVNVLIKNSVCKIADFGFTKVDLLGLPMYASPEQANGFWCDKSTDIYPLGLILFEFFITLDNDAELVCVMLKLQKPERFLPENFFERHKHTSSNKLNESKELLLQMTAYDSSIRPTIQDVLNHPFLIENENPGIEKTQQNNENNNDNNDKEMVDLINSSQLPEEIIENIKKSRKLYKRYEILKNDERDERCDEDNSIISRRNVTPTQSIQQNTFEISVGECKYKNNFIELSALGKGGFSTVFKAEYKYHNDNIMYAIKKVCFDLDKKESVTNELIILSKLDSKYVVKYLDSWIEPNYYIGSYIPQNQQNVSSGNRLYDPNLKYLLHIQMELCPLTLRDAIDYIIKECLTGKDKTLTLIGYYVSSELFVELVECVKYLHSLNPPIIHRDLKPENILLTICSNNRFVKLSDFGLSTFHEFADQSHTKGTGTNKYRAIEVNSTSKYTTKADIYSLGIILHELLNFDNSEIQKTYLEIIESKFNYLINLSEKLLSPTSVKRPTSDVLLRETDLWRLKNEELFSDQQFMQITSNEKNVYSIDSNFIEYFVYFKHFGIRENSDTLIKYCTVHNTLLEDNNSDLTENKPSGNSDYESNVKESTLDYTTYLSVDNALLNNLQRIDTSEDLIKHFDSLSIYLKSNQCSSQNYTKILETVLILIGKILNNRNTIALSKALYKLVTNYNSKLITYQAINRELITKTLDVLHLKCEDTQVTFYLIKTLEMFNIPENVDYEYKRVVNIVLHILNNHNNHKSMFEECFYLLYILSGVKSKRHVIGNESGIKTILKQIRKRVEQKADDYILMRAWSVLWNISDENAVVCENFAKCDGLQCFSECYAAFHSNLKVIQRIFGVLRNFSEWPQLRHLLLDKAYMKIFMNHLDWRNCGDTEQCFTVGGILSHLLLVDKEIWNRKIPDIRTDIQMLLNAAIPQWNVKTERSIAYTSFKPFQQILLSDQSPNESKYYAIWELANLTYVNASKYCPYLKENNLLDLFDSVAKNTEFPTNMRLLALTVMQRYESYKNNNNK